MPYPTGADLLAHLEELGLAPSSPVQSTLDRRAAAAAQEWERDVDWRPFLSTGQATARTLGACGGLVDLGGGLLSLSSLSLGGRALSPGTDYDAQDYGSGVVQTLRLKTWGTGALVLTGVWGRVMDVPPDVFEAILAKATLPFLNATVAGSGQLKKETAGPVTYEYETRNAATTQAGALQGAYDEAVMRWKYQGVA